MWGLNKTLLKDPKIAAGILKEITSYFSINVGSVENLISVWPSHKCYIRGITLKHGRPAKQQCNKTLSDQWLGRFVEHYC